MHAPEIAPRGEQPTARAVLKRLTGDFKRAGIESGGEDARRLVAATLGLSRAELLSRPEQVLTGEQLSLLEQRRMRRLAREPVSRILGRREFYGRDFAITPATFDPRPESETVIDAVLELVRSQRLSQAPLRILDVGTGCGCLLLTLLSELAGAVGTGSDISAAVLACARDNAHRLGLGERASWLLSDALEGLEGDYQVLVANPPYIRSADIAQLEPEVRLFDPVLALDGGEDGLVLYRRIVEKVPAVAPNGWIVFEVGCDQAEAVAELLTARAVGIAPEDIRVFKDLAGRPRCVAGRARN
jgi:release factor glutamine methyltransferase